MFGMFGHVYEFLVIHGASEIYRPYIAFPALRTSLLYRNKNSAFGVL